MTGQHKLMSRFTKDEYEVTRRSGNEVELINNGKTIRRHVSHVKRVPAEDSKSPLALNLATSNESMESNQSNQNGNITEMGIAGEEICDVEDLEDKHSLKLNKKKPNG